METIPGASDVIGKSHASTSEVGSAHREFEDHGADNLENFDRPVPSVPMEVYYEKMLKLQNTQIERLIQALKQPSTSDNKKTNLPEFDPDRNDMEAKAWCDTVALCMEQKPLSGSSLIIALSTALKGSASSWFSQISYSGMDWNHFRQIFLSRFDATETSAAALVRVNSSVPADGESMAVLANRTLTTFMARWKDLSVEQIAVSTVLARCVQIEPRLQRLAHTTELKDRTSMQRELMAYSYKKRTNNDRASNEPAKRSKTVTCYTCGRMGHKSNECLRNHKAKMTKMDFKKVDTTNKGGVPKRSVVCFKCGRVGHIAPQCSDRRASPSPAAIELRSRRLRSTGELTLVASSRCRRSSHTLDVDTDVCGEHRENLVHILEKYRTSFVIGTPTGCANTGEIEIKLIDPNRTVQRRPYRLSPDERQVCRDKIKELLAANIIRQSCSPFASPILLFKKKDGSDRLCVDYRELNRNTVPDKFPLPLISDQIQRLKGANYFPILDAASGFHQIPVHKDSIERIAFVTPDGQYEYLTMPFGWRNAPSVFQRAMHKALGDLVNTFVVCYLDDMMIVSDNEKEGLERLDIVLQTLKEAGISLNLKKCSFLKTRVEYFIDYTT
ncbi:hypothetical protein EVAR_10006_1 [Eumeta japonica]|uniref:Retrovirus-related Pol polyprotein from transposon 17.6 n=1 Tax=Eumeta variegata TaxID=151549 RepID=A0A4C1TR91_EUMVA|nr:hypothetical protein EVAR_10006_1 [Eumeta japonica]